MLDGRFRLQHCKLTAYTTYNKESMTRDEMMKSLGYCGLMCRLCFQGAKCRGCKSAHNSSQEVLCDEGCYQKKCCIAKGNKGCWQCDDIYTCIEGIYSLGNYSKIKAFAICMKEDGKEFFIDQILKNMERELSVEKGKDYDNKHISEVLNMIRETNEGTTKGPTSHKHIIM